MEYTKHELVALNTFLAYWPDGLTYAEVINRLNANDTWRFCEDDDGINAGNDDIDLLADYSDLEPDHVAQMIEDLHQTLQRTYGGY